MRRSRNCPVCRQPGIPIVYGFPSSAVFQAADKGLLAIGGCVITEDAPSWWCEKDQVGWDGPDPSRAIREVLGRFEPEAKLSLSIKGAIHDLAELHAVLAPGITTTASPKTPSSLTGQCAVAVSIYSATSTSA